jgi:hypothetical protein
MEEFWMVFFENVEFFGSSSVMRRRTREIAWYR